MPTLEINECLSQPCGSGGNCQDLVGAWFCECDPIYEGKTCESRVSVCDSNPCQNQAICIESVELKKNLESCTQEIESLKGKYENVISENEMFENDMERFSACIVRMIPK